MPQVSLPDEPASFLKHVEYPAYLDGDRITCSNLLSTTIQLRDSLDRQLLLWRLEPLVRMEGRYRLLGRGDEILVVFVAGHLRDCQQDRSLGFAR